MQRLLTSSVLGHSPAHKTLYLIVSKPAINILHPAIKIYKQEEIPLKRYLSRSSSKVLNNLDTSIF